VSPVALAIWSRFLKSRVFNSGKSMLAKDNTMKSETIVIDYKKSAIVFHYKTDGKKSMETYTPEWAEARHAECVVRSIDFKG
jgi:hypothetical protein